MYVHTCNHKLHFYCSSPLTYSTMAYPLSLKKQSMLYVICNVEHFKTEALKRLPEKIRHVLLHNLPVVDICRLEEAGVAEGININRVWDDLGNSRVPRRFGYNMERNVSFEMYCDDWKAYYFGIVNHILFNRIKPEHYRHHYELILHLLFGVQDCLGIYGWTCYRFSYFAPIMHDRPLIPNRYLRYLTTRRSDVQFLKLIMDVCSYRPTFLFIVCDRFSESDIFNTHASHLLTRYSPKVEKVVFSFEFDDRAGEFIICQKGKSDNLPCDATALVLKSVLSNDPPALTSLDFKEFNAQMLDESLKTAGPLFYAAVTSKSNKHIPYLGLQEITIQLCGPAQCPSNEALQRLSTVIKNQVGLEKLTFHQLLTEKAHLSGNFLRLLSSLSPSIKKPCFKTLTLKHMCVAVEGAQNIMDAFLSSPCPHRQNLCFSNVTVVGEPSEEDVPRKIMMHEDGVKYKGIEFFYCDFPPNFFKWFFAHPQLRLWKIEIINCKLQESLKAPPYARVENVLHHIAMHSDFQVQHVDLSHIRPPHNYHSRSDFEKILSNPHLRSFTVRSGNIGHHGLLPDLAAGVRRQAELGTLDSLSIPCNELGDMPMTELQVFFHAVFSLPQLERFDLNLSHNDLNSEQYINLFDTWKALANGKRVKTFSCIGGGFPEDKEVVEKIEEVAVKSYHW